MAKKNSEKRTDTNKPQKDVLEEMKERRAELEGQADTHRGKSRSEGSDTAFWGIVGGLAIAADCTMLGGIGTGLMIWSGVLWADHGRDAKRLEKEIAKIDESIAQMQLIRAQAEAASPKPPMSTPTLSEEFSPAAQKEIETLREQVNRMEQELHRLQDTPPELDKPKFKPPGR